MPIEIEYTPDDIGIIFKAVGAVTGKEIIEGNINVFNNPRFKHLKYWIVDRSACTDYNVKTADVEKIASIDNAAAENNPDLLMALVSETDLQFGVSRMFEAQISEPGFKTKVFRSRDAAEEWIASELNKQ